VIAEPGSRLGFLLEASLKLVLLGELLVHDLESHLPRQVQIIGTIDGSHSTLT
jgi:hypothetical protein